MQQQAYRQNKSYPSHSLHALLPSSPSHLFILPTKIKTESSRQIISPYHHCQQNNQKESRIVSMRNTPCFYDRQSKSTAPTPIGKPPTMSVGKHKFSYELGRERFNDLNIAIKKKEVGLGFPSKCWRTSQLGHSNEITETEWLLDSGKQWI